MPDWLRRRLIAGLDASREMEIKNFFDLMMIKPVEGSLDEADIKIARANPEGSEGDCKATDHEGGKGRGQGMVFGRTMCLWISWLAIRLAFGPAGCHGPSRP